MNDDNIFMDVDGPEFLNEVNNEINDFRAHVSPNDTIEQNIQNFYNAQPMDNNIGMSLNYSSFDKPVNEVRVDFIGKNNNYCPESFYSSSSDSSSSNGSITSLSTSLTSLSSNYNNYGVHTTASSTFISPSYSLTQSAVFDCKQIAVLDTNFLISNLGYLTALSTQAEKYLGSLVVVLPWVVVRELDGLKGRINIQSNNKNGANGRVGDLARKAMKFIQTALLDQRGWLRGQKIEEVFDPVAKSAKGDDSILDCCRYFAQLQKPITLLTNDRNLAIKAMVHDIQSLSSDNRDRLIHFASSLSHYVSTPPSLPLQHHQKRQQQEQQQYSIQNHDNLRVIDEDVDMMDESDDIDVARQQAQHILETQQREQENIQATLINPNSDSHYNVWASRHAPTQRSSSYSKSNNSNRYSNTLNLWDDKPVLDANGEPLIPPSSSAGRVEEMRRKKKGRQQY